jgi:hypothetical protein
MAFFYVIFCILWIYENGFTKQARITIFHAKKYVPILFKNIEYDGVMHENN